MLLPRGKGTLSYDYMYQMRGTLGAARAQTCARGLSVRNLNRRKSASCGHCSFRLISPRAKHPPQAVARGSSLDPYLRMELDAANRLCSRSCL